MYKGNQFFRTSGNTYSFTKALKNNLRCLGSVLIRCLTPFEEEQGSLSKNKANILKGIFHTILAFILSISKIGLGIYPFGISILCASSRNACMFSYIGSALGSLLLGFDGVIQFVSLSVIFLLRKNISESKYDEKLPIRLIFAAVCSIFIGACSLFPGKINANLILSYICFITLSVLTTYLFSFSFDKKTHVKNESLYILSVYSICVCLIPAFNGFSFAGLDTGLIAACFITLLLCREKGPVFGCMAGFIMGFGCTNPLLCAPIGMGGLVSGYLFAKNKFLSLISFVITILFSSLYLFGFSSISDIFPFATVAVLLFSALQQILPRIFPHCKTKTPSKAKQQKTPQKDEFDKVSDSLSGLSSLIYKFAEHMKAPSKAETGSVFDKAFCEVCDSCSMSEMCYAKRESNFSSVRSKVISTLHTSVLSEGQLSELLLGKCIKTRELCEFINSRYSELNFFAMRSNRTGAVASIYSSMSRLIKSTNQNQTENEVHDERMEKNLSNALSKIGVEFSQIEVLGARSKSISIYGISPDKIPCSSSDLTDYLSGECKIELSEPTFDIADNATLIMRISRKDIVKIEYASCSEAKSKSSVNGDTMQFFETDSGKFHAIIADGMGSGKTAAATSRLSCVFLEKMLRAGATKNVCLEMLNSLLLSKNDETFSGVDILEIDKLCGNANFIKAGAAPSYILRSGKLYKISSETPPVGIISVFSAESTRFTLENSDVIIMVSDGVISGEDDGIWLSELIHMDSECEPAFLASQLIERARSINKIRDDASACVIKIEI